MTAFFGIIHFDGKSVDRCLLQNMAGYLSRIGPDRQEIRMKGSAGFCQAELNPENSGGDSPSFEHNERYVVVGDIRIDARKELLAALKAKGAIDLDHASDRHILLNAWLVWGDRLTDRVMGDFSLAIWDMQAKKLFCLRDHMGVRPFYYAQIGKTFIFSNVLNCLRLHPQFPNELNDQAVVDFLVFAFNQEFDTTIFKNIQQLAPAHTMRVSQKKTVIGRYWTLPVDDTLRYRRANDYVDHFRELLDVAVQDRLPSTDIGVAMSGGLDSTSIAACAHEFLPAEFALKLYTLDIKSLWSEDEEAVYAKLTAQKFNTTVYVQNISGSDLFQYEKTTQWLLPEPSRDAFRLPLLALMGKMAVQNRVGLTGHGSDSLLLPSPAHFNTLLRKHQWWRFLVDTSRYIQVFHRRPPFYLRSLLKKRFERSSWRPTLPPWLQTRIIEQAGLKERFADKMELMFKNDTGFHPERPEAFLDLSSSIWQPTLMRFDPQTTGIPIQFNHPYFDIRLLRFVLAMPAMPWFPQKKLLRRAMTGRLPEMVRVRTKAMPRISPVHRGMTKLKPADWQRSLANLENATKYINVNRLKKLISHNTKMKSDEADFIALPIAFGNWLKLNSL